MEGIYNCSISYRHRCYVNSLGDCWRRKFQARLVAKEKMCLQFLQPADEDNAAPETPEPEHPVAAIFKYVCWRAICCTSQDSQPAQSTLTFCFQAKAKKSLL